MTTVSSLCSWALGRQVNAAHDAAIVEDVTPVPHLSEKGLLDKPINPSSKIK